MRGQDALLALMTGLRASTMSTRLQSMLLNPWFAPLVYAASTVGKLLYIQKNPNANLDEEIQKASDRLR